MSHGCLLIRSPAHPSSSEVSIDIICSGVEYVAAPRHLGEIVIRNATELEITALEELLQKRFPVSSAWAIEGTQGRSFVVAASLAVREHKSDIFEPPYEFGSKTDRPSLNDNDILEITQRCHKATSGPWVSYVEGREEMSGSDFIATGGEDIYLTGATVADQDFIACARQDIPKLVAEIERLKEQLNR